MLKKLIGTKAFYKQIFALAIPIMLQNGITNFVNMLDNIMVGRIGQAEMTGVAISNQLIFVFNLCIFGALSGAGIFTAQFFGNGDHLGVKFTFRFKVIICTVFAALGIGILFFYGNPLISLYLKGDGSVENASATLKFAREYINIILIGLIPYTLAQCYSSTLRETGRAVLPMAAGIIAVFVNLILNYILIFGHLGFSPLGVKGAAIATTISRFVELLIVAIWTFKNRYKNPFIIGAFRGLYVPRDLAFQIIRKGTPLVLNETMWAAGIATLNQCYSVRGLEVVAANNINQTFFNVFSVAFIAVGASIGIILGQMLGAGDTEGAKTASYQLIVFSVFVSIIFAAVFFVSANFIPLAYNASDSVRRSATLLMQICAVAMPIDAFAHATYFTMRSGGKTIITLIFDSGFVWFIAVPIAFVLSRFTNINIFLLYGICQLINIIKCIGGFILVRQGSWLKNIIK